MTETAPGALARGVMRGVDRATLATIVRPDLPEAGSPYASLVLVALDHDASPILLISALADHTRNIVGDARVSLLFDGTAGLEDALTGPRVSVLGHAVMSKEPRHRARFLARHPSAATYAEFGDFAFYRVDIARAHLVAGFGRIHWIAGDDLRCDVAGSTLAVHEAEILEHMNGEHIDAVQLYARLLGRNGDGWRMTGVDPEGADLRRGGEVARLTFDNPVHDPESARAELVRLVKRAREAD